MFIVVHMLLNCLIFPFPFQSLIAPVAFSIGIGYIAQFELQQVGLQFANMMSSPVGSFVCFFVCCLCSLFVISIVVPDPGRPLQLLLGCGHAGCGCFGLLHPHLVH